MSRCEKADHGEAGVPVLLRVLLGHGRDSDSTWDDPRAQPYRAES